MKTENKSLTQLKLNKEVDIRFRQMNFTQASVVTFEKRNALTCCDGMSFASTPFTMAVQSE